MTFEPNPKPTEQRSAVFSDCRTYRYRLDIVWESALPLCQFVGLNPSTADEVKDDPTIRRCKDFARRWGYGGLVMTNLFAFRATLPKDMRAAAEPVGEPWHQVQGWHGPEVATLNDYHLLNAAHQSGLIVAAWGTDGTHRNRYYHVAKLLSNMKCFGRAKNGQPLHPLYMPKEIQLEDYALT